MDDFTGFLYYEKDARKWKRKVGWKERECEGMREPMWTGTARDRYEMKGEHGRRVLGRTGG